MGRDLAEGHVHALERQLGLAKAALEDMRRAYLQLEDVTHHLDDEAEDLQAQVGRLSIALKFIEFTYHWRHHITTKSESALAMMMEMLSITLGAAREFITMYVTRSCTTCACRCSP